MPNFTGENKKLNRGGQNELNRRLDVVNAELGADILPDEVTKLTKMSRGELRELVQKYPLRYRMFRQILNADAGRSESITDEELESIQISLDGLKNLEKYIADHDENGGTLKDKQFEVFTLLHEFLEKGKKRGKVVLPTGVGKTVLFTEFTKAFDLSTLIVVPTKDLVNQTVGELNRFAPNLDVGRVFTGAKDFDKHVVVTTYDSLVVHLESGNFDPSKYKAVIFDEAHVALTDKRKEAAKKLEDAGAIIIEFTATDAYSLNKQIESDEIFRMETVDAIEEELLCGVSCIIAKVKVDTSKFLIKTVDGLDVVEFEKELKRKAVYKSCVEMHQKAFKNEKAIVSCSSVAGARAAAVAFAQSKKRDGKYFRPAVLHGGLLDHEREEIIQGCLNGEYDVLCGVVLIETGLNLPNFSVLYNVTPRFSVIPATQRGGRVLRLDKNNPDKVATVVDFLYVQEDDKKALNKKPILYSEILGRSFVMPKGKRDTEDGGEDVVGEGDEEWDDDDEDDGEDWYDDEPLSIEIEGVEIITDAEEVMKVIRGLNESKEAFNFEKLQAEVRAHIPKINSSKDYEKYSPKNNWPALVTLKQKPEWQKWIKEGKNPWDEFLSREARKSLNFKELLMEVRFHIPKINSVKKYEKYSPKNSWPSKRVLYKKPEWQEWIKQGKNPWDEFLDREARKSLNFKELQEEVGQHIPKINSSLDYAKYCSINVWPAAGTLSRKPEWQKWIKQGKNPWDEFLGRTGKDKK
jgi:superfamily II DNA or RNA helicase